MTACLALVSTIVAIVAAARSTWSPCGLSMLSTITPVSEQAKGNSYRTTATWFVVGAAGGGATLGVAMAALAAGVHSLGLAPATAGILALGAALIAAGSDAGIGGFRLPIHGRQVNERWLDRYRPWVYGAGFGWQIGTGLATYIATAAVYLMIVLGALTASPVVALAVGTGFGVLRGLAVLLTRRLTTPMELLAFHRRFNEAGPWFGRAAVVVEAAAAAVVAGYLRSPAAVTMIGLALGLSVLSLIVAKKPGLVSAPASSWSSPSPTSTPSSTATGTARRGPKSDPAGPAGTANLVGQRSSPVTD